MCGRYSLTTPLEAMTQAFPVANLPNLPARYNIAPTQAAPVIRRHPDGRLLLHNLVWGLIPHWARDRSGAARLINARSETVDEKPAFRDAFRRHRCLIPADGFYEWRRPDPKTREPWRIVRPDRRIFAFAGLWERWSRPQGGAAPVDSFTIITTAASEPIAPIHDRMPVMLEGASAMNWLNPGLDGADLLDLLQPTADVTAYRVSDRVGKVQNDDAGLIEPLGAEGLFDPAPDRSET